MIGSDSFDAASAVIIARRRAAIPRIVIRADACRSALVQDNMYHQK